MDVDDAFASFQGPVPWLRRAEMAEVGRLVMETFGVACEALMENAGRHLAVLTKTRFLGRIQGRQVRVLVGGGRKGGGALVPRMKTTRTPSWLVWPLPVLLGLELTRASPAA